MLQDGPINALGTMSGTSLDGVDAAVIRTDGVKIFDFGPSNYHAYSNDERRVLRNHLGRWQNDDLRAAAQIVEDTHIGLMRGFADVDIAGFHGQTLAHDPGGRGTHQVGDGVRVANALGLPVAWDFRSEDVAKGGQGAPLAPFFHFALAKWLECAAPIAFLNLGGVGNITWIDPQHEEPQHPGALLAFDTGPANAPINDVMGARLGLAFDHSGTLAAQGRPDAKCLSAFRQHPYFIQAPPKSLDRDAFAGLTDSVIDLPDADAVRTLLEAAVTGVTLAMDHCPTPPKRLLVTGGGRKNATMMASLSDALACDVSPVESVGLDGDMIEAQAFAFLAVRVLRKLPISSPATTGVAVPCLGGQLAWPN